MFGLLQLFLRLLHLLPWFFGLAGLLLGGSKNRMESLNIKISNRNTQVTKKEETKNLRKSVFASKVVNPFTRALAPPFIGRRRGFYIPRIPSNLENIPSVNTYMNVFYISWFAGLISYIYKSATSSHFQPGLLKCRLWLGLFPDSRSFFPKDHHPPRFPNWGSLWFLNFVGSWSPESHQILVVLKHTVNLRTEANSAVIFTYH
jgi:hypothetical protein